MEDSNYGGAYPFWIVEPQKKKKKKKKKEEEKEEEEIVIMLWTRRLRNQE